MMSLSDTSEVTAYPKCGATCGPAPRVQPYTVITYPSSPLHFSYARMFRLSKHKRKDKSPASPTNTTAADDVSSSTSPMALASRRAPIIAAAPPSTPSVAFPAEYL
jgi:hypothetical protein